MSSPEQDTKEPLSSATQPVFPPELFDSVIDHLHDDKAALRQCTLICREWLPASTFHLFSTLSWPPCHHMWYARIPRTSPMRKFCHCGEAQAGFDRCLSLLSTTPRIAAAVQCLKLNSSRSVHHIDGSTRFTDEAISRSTLLAILDCLSHLRTVELTNCLLEREGSHIGDIFAAREVGEVRIVPRHDHGYVPLYRALEALSVFSRLRRLSIDGQECRPLLTGGTPLLRRTRVAALEVICEDADSTESIMTILLQRTDPASLRSLTLSSPLGDRSASSFVAALPSALETLEYHVVRATPDIERFAELRSLTLVGSLHIEQGGLSEWPDMMRDLGAVAGPAMDAVGLTLQVYEDPFWTFWQSGATLGDMPFNFLTKSLQGQDWSLLRTHLHKCRALKQFRVKIELKPMLDGQGRLLRDIPRCRRIVQELAEELLPASVASVTTVEVACSTSKA
ncbi:hypothetical protein PsYK624_129570 [Phanerochaete sordida]|uniref:F-box domain-containing protein n=1 Tax=Phanerochaete sordida TaxID=48140 RepID=A0A9P3GL52_9APHY|nr:hypothetical protein PsYK624_129570 [Phanerochaete sordida]